MYEGALGLAVGVCRHSNAHDRCTETYGCAIRIEAGCYRYGGRGWIREMYVSVGCVETGGYESETQTAMDGVVRTSCR